MKKLILLLIFLITYSFVNAQIEDIKKNADKNKDENKENYDSYLGNNNSNSNPCAEACVQAIGEIIVSIFADLLIAHHGYIMYELDEPRALSLSFRPEISYGYHYSASGGMNYANFTPGINGRFGIYSMDFRLNYLMDYDNGIIDSYKSWEWLIMQLNIQPVTNFRFIYGAGLFKENYLDQIKAEQYLGIEFSNNSKSQIAMAELRIVPYQNEITFTEVCLKYNQRIIDTNHFFVYLFASGVYQNYYTSHDIWLVKTGFSINIH